MNNPMLVFIDSGVNYYQHLLNGVVAEARPFILDTVSDGIQQIEEILQQYPGEKTVHIISHGAPGCLYLGNTELSLDTLKQYTPQLQHWDIDNLLLYGCHVASGDAGEEFVSKLQNLTGANIAASKSLTGAAVKGGNWDLEVNTGRFKVPPALQAEVMETYSGIFNLKQESTFASKEVIVKLSEKVKVRSLNRLQAKLGVTAVSITKTDPDLQLWSIAGDVEDFIRDNEHRRIIEYIEPNYKVSKNSIIPNDPSFDELWGLDNTGQTGGTSDADIDAPEAWELQTGSNDVVVGVIDTGIDYTHPDLVDNMWTNPGETPGDGIDNDNNGYVDDYYGYDFANDDSDPFDGDGHGTHVAGTIGAKGDNGEGITGVNWDVDLMAIKFLDDQGFGSTFDAIRAVEYATMMGADITNNSWGGGGYSQALSDAIEAAGAADSLFIAAAGNNSGRDNDVIPAYPASYDLDNIISVASTTHRDNLSNFSNIGATSVDLGAPGSSIYSTIPGGGYASFNGTSMATPHVSGVAALLLAENPELSYEEVKAAILESTDEISALDGNTLTGGRLNAFEALLSINDAPTDITITNDTIDENVAANTLVGTLSTIDSGTADIFTYELVTGDGDIDNGDFTIDGDELIINISPDFEAQSSYDIRIKTTDVAGASYEEEFTINVENVNEEPTAIEIDNDTIDENVAADTVVGTFSTTDPDNPDSFTYTLVAGNGDDDNGAFTIDGDDLKINSSPDYETQSSYDIRVQTTDAEGASYEEVFTINVENVNEEPTALEIDNDTIDENVAADTVVGTFSTTDPDNPDSFTYTLVAGNGDDDNGAFTIDDDELKINSSPDYETQSSYDIRVQTTDAEGASYEEVFTINVENVNEEPTALEIDNDTIEENVAVNTVVGTFSTTDPDDPDDFTYELVAGDGDDDNGAFTIDGDDLKINNSPDYETQSSYDIRVQTTDGEGETYQEVFTINVDNVNEEPTALEIDNDTIEENVAAETVVGTFSTTDPDIPDDFTYTLVTGDGDTDNGAFTIDGDDLKINNSPDYETQSSYDIRVQTTDAEGEIYEEEFTINVENVNEEPTALEIDNDTIDENVAAETVVGTFSTTDPDIPDDFTYTLVTGDGDTDNAAFSIDGDDLKINSSPDYETQSSYDIRVQTTDAEGETYEEEFTINVENVNEEPTALEIDNDTIDENVAAETVVGTFLTTDTDDPDSFTYELVAGDGDTDNGAFSIDGDDLKINSSPDYETQSSYDIRVQTTDEEGETYEETFTINVNDLDEEPVRFDFNSDRIPDILWRHETTGSNRIWLMNDEGKQESLVNPGSISTGWDVGGVDDFNTDGIADILWRHGSSGSNRIWLMNDEGKQDDIINPGSIGTNWDVAGVDDFNNDGVADILWRHGSDGSNRIWLMNDEGKQDDIINPGSIGTNWDVGGVDDFNNDGVADIFWHHTTNGSNRIWLMNDEGKQESIVNPGSIGTNWDVGGVDDFDNDGVADIFWHHANNGSNRIWLMNDEGKQDDVVNPGSIDIDWDVAGVFDFNTDGVGDILWRNGTDGTNNIWFMNVGGTFSESVDPGSIGTNWDVAGM